MENISSNISPVAMLVKKIDQQKVSRNTNWAEETHNFDLDITSDIIVGITVDKTRARFLKFVINQYKLHKLRSTSTTFPTAGYNGNDEWGEKLSEYVQLKLEIKEEDEFFSQNETLYEGENDDEKTEENLVIKQYKDKIAELEQGIYVENGEKKKTLAAHVLDLVLIFTHTDAEKLSLPAYKQERENVINITCSLSGAKRGTIEQYLKPSHRRNLGSQEQVKDLNIARCLAEVAIKNAH